MHRSTYTHKPKKNKKSESFSLNPVLNYTCSIVENNGYFGKRCFIFSRCLLFGWPGDGYYMDRIWKDGILCFCVFLPSEIERSGSLHRNKSQQVLIKLDTCIKVFAIAWDVVWFSDFKGSIAAALAHVTTCPCSSRHGAGSWLQPWMSECVGG